MSHQTGIKANENLSKFFGKCKVGEKRVIKVSIENEELVCSGSRDVIKDWEKDYDQSINPLIEKTNPCYILYRLDKKTPLGYAWLLLNWVPDVATVRQKMIYASTKATLKSEFGSAHITEEIHATVADETTLEGYYKHKKTFAAPIPLTTREEELEILKKTEVSTNICTESRQQTLGGIYCPITEKAIVAIKNFISGQCNYVQFSIDLKEEQIHVEKTANVSVQDLHQEIPSDNARYHTFLFKHTHEGDYLESLIFIYSMPGYNCSVKERMMYSSCKAPFLENLQSLGADITKKLEIENGTELTEEFFQEELHPKKMLYRPQFAKPKGPPNRGAKRLTRPQTD